MMQVLMVLWVANRKVYGAHKLWKAARRAGHDIGRDQVARLMRELDIEGVSRRRRKVFTTRPDPDAVRAPDLVNRNFTADRPDALWVTDLTYVPTRSGMAYVCFIVDAFSRRIVGWRVAANMRTEMVLDALEMARRSRGGRRLSGSSPTPTPGRSSRRCGSPNGSTRSAPAHRSAPSPTRFDNALAETTNGLYKAECVYGPDAPRLGRRRRPRARHPVVGALVQRAPPPRPLRRHPASRVRSSSHRGARTSQASTDAPPSRTPVTSRARVQPVTRSAGRRRARRARPPRRHQRAYRHGDRPDADAAESPSTRRNWRTRARRPLIADCGTFMRRVGISGTCPCCDEPITVEEVLERSTSPFPSSQQIVHNHSEPGSTSRLESQTTEPPPNPGRFTGPWPCP